MQIAVGIRWTIIVNDNVYPLNIYTTTEDIRGDKNALLECFKSRVPVDAAISLITPLINERESH